MTSAVSVFVLRGLIRRLCRLLGRLFEHVDQAGAQVLHRFEPAAQCLAEFAGSGEQASRSGLVLSYVSNLEDVVEGDPIVTSGLDGIYPKGIAVGRVESVRNGPRLFKLIAVEPAANLERLEEVFILPPVEPLEITQSVE